MYTFTQWADIIRQARKRKPFVVMAGQSLILNFNAQLSPFFKKTIRGLNIQKARMIEYSEDHITEVCVKYTLEEEEQWSKFLLFKARAIVSFPAQINVKYHSRLPVKANKVADITKIVKKYVPVQFQPFYRDMFAGNAS